MKGSILDFEIEYSNLIKRILEKGTERQTRNAVTKSLFGETLTIDCSLNVFPLLLGRKIFYKGVAAEFAAFLKGPKHINDFKNEGCNYWDKWAKADGSINVDYGNSWIDFNGVNQIEELVKGLKQDPFGRRHIISGWRPDRLKELDLPCCHLLYQWYIREENGYKTLDMIWYQRSVDTMIGLPSDIVLAYIFNTLIANEIEATVGTVKMFLGDTHIYKSHFDNALKYCQNVDNIRPETIILPTYKKELLKLNNFCVDNLIIENYQPAEKLDFELIA